MTQRISKPEAYIIGRASLPDGRHLSLDVMRTALDAVEDKSAIELLDLESANPAGDLASFIVKISAPLPPPAFAQMAEVAQAASGNGVEYKLVRAEFRRSVACPGVARGIVQNKLNTYASIS